MKLSNIVIGFLTTTTLVTGWVAYDFSYVNKKHKKDYLALSELNLQLNKKLQFLENDLSNYQQESKNNKALIASLNNQLSELTKDSSPSKVVTMPMLQQEQPKAIEPSKTKDVSKSDTLLAFARKIQNGESIAGIESNIRKKFNEEEVDGNWAYEYENNIRDLVAMDGNNNIDIQELSCKTSTCEVKISANETNAMVLGTMFSKLLGEQDWRDKNAGVIFNHEVKGGAMSILIGRDKHSFK